MDTLTKRLAGPSTAKAGMETVDQAKVNDIIYKASEVALASRMYVNPRQGSKFFESERKKDMELTKKIEDMLRRLKAIEGMDLSYEQRKADQKVRMECVRDLTQILQWESSRDLTQYIVHIGMLNIIYADKDCDAFYASVEELDRPELKYSLQRLD